MTSAGPRQFPPANGVKTAIVTGGSSGIGRATALALAKSGWNVTISGRREDQLAETVRTIQDATINTSPCPGVEIFMGDMTSEDAVKAMFRQTQTRWGQIDLVFVNAGRSGSAVPLQEATLSEWQSIVDVNLTAAWLCAREAFRFMDGTEGRQLGGRIVMNGSISARVPRPMSAAYTATKHAISGLSKSLALDGRKHYIAVSQIDIGNVVSDMTKRMGEGPGVMQADGSLRQEPVFDVEYAAQEIVHIGSLPLTVTIQEVVIMATNMPSFIGRG